MIYRGYSKKRNSLCYELLFLMLVSSRFFDLNPLAPLLAGGGQLFLLLGTLAIIYMTQLGFQLRTGILKNMKTVWWILGGLSLSYLAAYLFYRQPVYLSFVVNRQFFSLLVFPLLLAVRPSFRELKWSLYAFSTICAIVTLYISFVDQSLVPTKEFMPFIEEGDFVHALSGLHFIVISFIIALSEFRSNRTVKKFIPVFLLFLFIFIAQNRTFLIATAAVIFLSVISNRSARSRLYAVAILGIAASMAFVILFNSVSALYMETMEQLSNPEYNRIKALVYIFSLPNGFISILIGNGFISGNFDPLVSNLSKEGIFYSDVGMFALWHVYGLLPVAAILASIIRGLSPYHSMVVRCNALLILVCSMTVGYYASIETLTWLCFYLYLLYSDEEYAQASKQRQAAIRQRLLRRYRSLSA